MRKANRKVHSARLASGGRAKPRAVNLVACAETCDMIAMSLVSEADNSSKRTTYFNVTQALGRFSPAPLCGEAADGIGGCDGGIVLTHIIHDSSSRNCGVARRDGRAEPRGREADLK